MLGFAAFGLFWGSWGAVLPAVQASARASQGELGLALLCIGAGALCTMRAAGALVDRFGTRVLPSGVVLFGAAAVTPALARSPLGLAAALLALGAASGALDVALNAEGVRAESAGRPVLSLAHGAFSALVVVGSLATGGLRGAGAGPGLVLGAVAIALVVLAAVLARMRAAPVAPRAATARRGRVPRVLLVLGGLTALAFFIENAWQSWSALHLERTLGAGAAVAALGPALFAASAAAGRLGGHPLFGRVGERALLVTGALVAAAGTALAAAAPSVAVALPGIALAGLGTSVCAPTLFSLAGRTPGVEQGAAVSTVSTLGYSGFLVGPAAVGLVAGAASLRWALGAVALLALLLALLAQSRRTALAQTQAISSA